MAQKETLISLLEAAGWVSGWENRKVISVPDLSAPGTVEESTRTIAEFCVNYNKFLQLWVDVPILDYGLRSGQRSSVQEAALLSFINRSPLTTGVGTGTTWLDYLGVAGLPGATPLAEHFWGIGATPNVEDVEGIFEAFETWKSSFATYADTVISAIEAARESYAAGETVAEYSAPTFPTLTLPVPVNPGLPAPIWIGLNILVFVIQHVVAKIIEGLIDDIIRKIGLGGDAEPFLKLFKKFALVKEGDIDLGMPDFTSLLLLAANKSIEIYNNLGVKDVFLDNLSKSE